MADINCTKTGCGRAFHTIADLVDHVTAQHANASAPPPPASSVAKLTHPTIDAGSSPAAWAAFMVQFEDYLDLGKVEDNHRKISELTRAIPKPCFERVNERLPAGAIYELSYVDAVKEAKRAVVSPETLSVRRSNFLQVRQKDGEVFVSFLSRARAVSYTHLTLPTIYSV